MQLFPPKLCDQVSWDVWRAIRTGASPRGGASFLRHRGAGPGRHGKSRIAALLLACFASRRYVTAPGERIYCAVSAPDRRQAA
jgi:hypothetical protein